MTARNGAPPRLPLCPVCAWPLEAHPILERVTVKIPYGDPRPREATPFLCANPNGAHLVTVSAER